MADRKPRQPANPEERANELAARKRVAALVSGGVHFKIKREGGRVQGQRGSGSAKLLARITSKTFTPEVTLDLRGQPFAAARDAIAGFIKVHHRRGVQQLLITFDPPSEEAGAESALEAVIAGLTMGAASALVRAFASARDNLGGDTALAVLLI